MISDPVICKPVVDSFRVAFEFPIGDRFAEDPLISKTLITDLLITGYYSPILLRRAKVTSALICSAGQLPFLVQSGNITGVFLQDLFALQFQRRS